MNRNRIIWWFGATVVAVGVIGMVLKAIIGSGSFWCSLALIIIGGLFTLDR